MELEIRTTGDIYANAGTIYGYAAVFNSQATLPGFIETVKPGAFKQSLSKNQIRALYDHQGAQLLGNTRSGTLELQEDKKGLAFSLDLPDTSYGRDLGVLIRRGDVAGCSFGFNVPDGGDAWEKRSGKWHRDLLNVDLQEITITANPAYSDTTVAIRTLNKFVNEPKYQMFWLETCR